MIIPMDDGVPLLRNTSALSEQVADLAIDDDDDGGGDSDDGDGNRDDVTEVSWLRNARTARYHVGLIPPR